MGYQRLQKSRTARVLTSGKVVKIDDGNKIMKLYLTYSLAAFMLFTAMLKNVNAKQIKTIQQAFTLCTGVAFSDNWNKYVDDFIHHIFQHSGLKVSLFKSSADRAEYHFRQGRCHGFFAASSDFPKQVDRHIVHVPEPALLAGVEVLARQAFTLHDLVTVDKSHIIGLFNSKSLADHIAKITNATLIPVQNLEQGISLLNKQRIEAFIYPNLKVNNQNMLNLASNQLKVEKLIDNVELYLWLNEEHADKAEQLAKNIKQFNLQSANNKLQEVAITLPVISYD